MRNLMIRLPFRLILNKISMESCIFQPSISTLYASLVTIKKVMVLAFHFQSQANNDCTEIEHKRAKKDNKNDYDDKVCL